MRIALNLILLLFLSSPFGFASDSTKVNKLNEGYVYAIGVNRLNKRNVLSLGALYLFNNNMEGFWNNFGILVPVVSLKVPIS